jgi:hypothetical protein
MLLINGNTKLGKGIWQFSLPAGLTCPGLTTICSQLCYAKHGHYFNPNIAIQLRRRYDATLLADFAPDMIEEIHKRNAELVRIHVAGDFYNVPYLEKWWWIVEKCPETTFFAYTRSWRVPEIRPYLFAFANQCENLRLWFSCDAETGYPEDISSAEGKIRTAYLRTAFSDVPPKETTLVLRDKPLLKVVEKRVGLSLVCPAENGITHTTCSRCGLCWKQRFVKKWP